MVASLWGHNKKERKIGGEEKKIGIEEKLVFCQFWTRIYSPPMHEIHPYL